MSSGEEAKDKEKGRDARLAAFVIAFTLIIAGAPLFVYVMTMDGDENGPTTAASKYYVGMINFNEVMMHENSVFSLEELDHPLEVSENIDEDFVNEYKERLRFGSASGVDEEDLASVAVANIEDHIGSFATTFGLDIDDWEVVAITIHDSKGTETGWGSDHYTFYVLLIEAHGDWYVDPLSSVFTLQVYEAPMNWDMVYY